jgi:preprotein translocase subunit SecG
MLMLPLAKVSFLWIVVMLVWLLIAAALILIVLIQKGRGGGLSSAFGGGGANSLLGTKTGDFLTWVTISLVALFLIVAVVMGKFMRPQESSSLAIPTYTQDASTTETPAADLATQAQQTADQAATEAQKTVEEAAAQTQQAVDNAVETAETTPAPVEQPAQN